MTVRDLGGFQLIDLIITELKDQMTCYEFECSLIGGKFICKKRNPLQDLLSSRNAVISTNERNWILTGHVIFKLCYNQIYQLKTTKVTFAPNVASHSKRKSLWNIMSQTIVVIKWEETNVQFVVKHLSQDSWTWNMWLQIIQVNLCQKHLFSHQLTHNMKTKDPVFYSIHESIKCPIP